ncbi:ionotropic receptor 21a-like [Palaemon carinicauda]|uniref:ionotropic receptor 21a-like n=1 Tax=Palaemon carinicauda TaxID=392227 RepID=UPI0035B6410B
MKISNDLFTPIILTLLQLCYASSRKHSKLAESSLDIRINTSLKISEPEQPGLTVQIGKAGNALPNSTQFPSHDEEPVFQRPQGPLYSGSHISDPTLNEKAFRDLYKLRPKRQSVTDIALPVQYPPRPQRQLTSRYLKMRRSHLGSMNNPKSLAEDHLTGLIKTILVNEMYECELIIAVDGAFQGSRIVDILINVPVPKQVLQLLSPEDLANRIQWKSKNCQGTFLLISDPEPLIHFGNKYKFQWAYNAKVVIVGLNPQSLEMFFQTMKGKKTEHIIGVVVDYSGLNIRIFMNLLFWGKTAKQISRWLGNRFTNDVDLFPDKTSNLQGGVVRVVMFDWRPIMIIIKDSKGKVTGRYGRDVVVMNTLSKVFNFTLVYIDIDQDWGVLFPNGSFSGLVGYLGRDDGDVGIANLYPSALDDRHLFQDYSSPLTEDRVCFLARVDPPLPRWQNPSLPFQQDTWLALFLGFLLAGPVLYVLALASNAEGRENSRFTTLVESCLASVAIHFEHPLGILPNNQSTRIFTIFLLLYSIIITTGYKANLTAFLTVTREPKSIETAEELYKSGIPVKSFPWFRTALQYSANPVHRALAENYVIRYTFDEIKDEILAGQTITINSRKYLVPSSTLIRTRRGKPLLRFLKECLSSYSVGIGYAMNFPLKEKFNRVLSRMFESGLANKWFQQTNEFYWKLKKMEGLKNYGGDDWYVSTDGVIPLGMAHMQGIFIVYVIGFVISKFIFLVELCYPLCMTGRSRICMF